MSTDWRGFDRAGEALTIREGTPRDAPRALEHMRILVDETVFMLQCAADALPDLADQRLLIEQLGRLDNCLCLVACVGGASPGRAQVIGNLTLLGGQTSRTRHLVTLGMGVRQSVCGRGIGGLLLQRAIDWARGNPEVLRVSLQVYGSNEIARNLYLSRGFEEEGTMVGEVALGRGRWEDLIGMSLDVFNPAAHGPH